MTDQNLSHILYISNSIETPTEADMEKLLFAARRNNQRDGITGVLLHHGKIFIQCIEGPRDQLDKLYARIEADPSCMRALRPIPGTKTSSRCWTNPSRLGRLELGSWVAAIYRSRNF